VAQPRDLKNQQRIGANVRRIRQERDMTIDDLAHATGMDTTAISKLELGKVDPRAHTLTRLGRALAVWPGELLRGVK
jgi:transcriptional regulator with XRE-family HTH domain